MLEELGQSCPLLWRSQANS